MMKIMKNQNNFYTIITGASSGLGRAFAIECASRKMNLILVSLPNEKLEKLSLELSSNYDVKIAFRELDLSQRDLVEDLAGWINENFLINILINNAGVGGTLIFTESSVDYLDNIIQLNVRAMTLLTRLLLPQMKQTENGYILNVSSLAAFSPVPYKTVYPASKAFVHHFTRGLKTELKDTSVKVSVLNPGPIMTNSDVSHRISGQSSYVKLSIMSPERIAQIAIKKLLKGHSVIIPGFMNRLNAFLIRLVPESFRIFVGGRIFERDLKEKQHHESIDNRSKRSSWQQSGKDVVTRKI